MPLNARGIRTFEKRKAIFSWLLNSGADICFLQETYSTQEEKNNKYFLNLENSNKAKSSVRKILATDGALTSDPKKIMNELELFYSNLYDGRNSADTQTFFLSL